MDQTDKHSLRILHFNDINQQSIYVKVCVYDAHSGKEFIDEVRFLDGMLYGDLVHPQRSALSPGCREYVRALLLNKYEAGEFN